MASQNPLANSASNRSQATSAARCTSCSLEIVHPHGASPHAGDTAAKAARRSPFRGSRTDVQVLPCLCKLRLCSPAQHTALGGNTSLLQIAADGHPATRQLTARAVLPRIARVSADRDGRPGCIDSMVVIGRSMKPGLPVVMISKASDTSERRGAYVSIATASCPQDRSRSRSSAARGVAPFLRLSVANRLDERHDGMDGWSAWRDIIDIVDHALVSSRGGGALGQ